MTQTVLTRRNMLVAGTAGLAMPYVWSRPARAAGQVVVRNPGGAYSDTQKKYIYDPFTKETGIEVVIVASTMAKMPAMVKTGNTELDAADAGLDGLITLHKAGALAPIDYAKWKYTDPHDIAKEYRTETTLGFNLYASVLGYNKEVFPEGTPPKNWEQFWDAKAFPGARMLADMASGAPNLEFALAIEWNQHMLQIQGLGIFKDGKNTKEAQLLVDYSMSAKPNSGVGMELNYGPINRKSFDLLPAAMVARLPGSPENLKRSFLQDVNWWDENRAKVNSIWSKWILT
jgi:spermidine/putrescine-binding protein